jgi:hypothetical protein
MSSRRAVKISADGAHEEHSPNKVLKSKNILIIDGYSMRAKVGQGAGGILPLTK